MNVDTAWKLSDGIFKALATVIGISSLIYRRVTGSWPWEG